jgi:hypothetical protein
MPIDSERFSTMANALQTALLLAVAVETDVQQAARDAGDVRAAVERAAVAAAMLPRKAARDEEHRPGSTR